MELSRTTRNHNWSFHLDVMEEAESTNYACRRDQGAQVLEVPPSTVQAFQRDGYVVFEDVLDTDTVHLLQERFEHVLRGHYDGNKEPDKAPRRLRSDVGAPPLGFSGNLKNVQVLQVINIHKCDRSFRRIAVHPLLGQVVATLAGWADGSRLAQDQVWAKPPHASQLSFHRDSPYFMFDPPEVVTVWVALDDMDPELGPLEYVVGSHTWGDGRVGSSNNFFDGGTSLLEDAAKREGLGSWKVVSMAGLRAGGISIHHGRTWHGSGKNQSRARPRRGWGLHYVPANVRFTPEASRSRLWKRYVPAEDLDPAQVSKIELPEEDFPVVWIPSDS